MNETLLWPLSFFKPVDDYRWSMKGDALPPPCQMMFNGVDCPKRAEVAVKRPDVVSIFYFCEEHAEKFR